MHPDALPDLFLDRSLGRIVVPTPLRAAGLRLVTLAEHYGVPADERVADEEWLTLAGNRGWAVLMKDTRVRYNLACAGGRQGAPGPSFLLSSQHLRAADMAKRFVDRLDAIAAACADDGPLIYAVHYNRIERLVIGDT
ncbi:MAG: hypothetical protein ACRDZW_05840 [Acidimicrobiales bacterium]